MGILLAMVGMILYSYYCTLENQQKAIEAAALASQVGFTILTLLVSLHFALSFTKTTFCDIVSTKSLQSREGKSDPIINLEKGSSTVTDSVEHMSPVWSKDKD
ncbi:hypothetical protein RYX36_010262 [Vicia faba]